MSARSYPLALAALRQQRQPWQALSVAIREMSDRSEASLTMDSGILAGVEIVVSAEAVRFVGLNSQQERLMARQADALARRLGRAVNLG